MLYIIINKYTFVFYIFLSHLNYNIIYDLILKYSPSDILNHFILKSHKIQFLLELEDPANWSSFISNQIRPSIVKKDAIQVKHFEFPLNEDQRSFPESFLN